MFMKLQIVLAVGLCLTASASAVKPGEWAHQAEADFEPGTLEHTVVTSMGRVQLSRATDPLAELEGEDSIVYDLLTLEDGRILMAVGPEAKLVAFDADADEGDRLTTVLGLEGEQIFSVTMVDDSVVCAISGADSRIEMRNPDDWSVSDTIELPGVRYVWDMVIVGGALWVATGTDGQVLVVGDELHPWLALDTKQDNVLCLGADGQGRVYAGTDGDGLIYRITPGQDLFTAPPPDEDAIDDADEDSEGDADEDGDDEPDAPEFTQASVETYVIYDAAEPEIGALLVLDDGTVYAGTADADQARPGRLEAAQSKSNGRPDDEADDEDAEAKAADSAEVGEDNAVAEQADSDADAETIAQGDEADEDAEPDDGDVTNADQAIAAADAAAPTPDQYDELRGLIRERLTEARETGALSVEPTQSHPPTGSTVVVSAQPGGAARRTTRAAAAKAGNAIYRIDTDGFAEEVFRESVMVLRIAESDGSLLVSTGNEGQLYRVDPDEEETAILVDLEPQQIPAMLVADDGRVLLGTANPGMVIALTDGYADEGTFTSEALDAEHISQWGRLRVTVETPDGTAVQLQTRAGNVGDPEAGSWTDWTDPQAVEPTGPAQPVSLPVLNGPARFIQYRLALSSDGDQSPDVFGVALKYQLPNLQPKIESITASYAAAKSGGTGAAAKAASPGPQPQTTLKVKWKAKDANDDALRYTLEYRDLEDRAVYIPLVEDHESDHYDWDTRTAPDGRYELRVTASDEADNVPDRAMTARRVSDPIVVDNTRPVVSDIRVEPGNEPGTVTVSLAVNDALSEIAEVRYQVSGEETWEIVLPADQIYDSTSESIRFTIADLTPGMRVVTLRATDALGNGRYVARSVRVPGP